MLFEMNKRKFESEKERNLYFKFFAGFYFNELIRGYQERLKEFYGLLRHPAHPEGKDLFGEIQPSTTDVFVSFDNHVDRHVEGSKGEFADILIHDQPNKLIIGVEAKFQDNWDYEKDIVGNGCRLQSMAGPLDANKQLLCLLVTETKWNNVVAKQNAEFSNYRKLDSTVVPTVVIQWEMLYALQCVNPQVTSYMIAQLARGNR